MSATTTRGRTRNRRQIQLSSPARAQVPYWFPITAKVIESNTLEIELRTQTNEHTQGASIAPTPHWRITKIPVIGPPVTEDAALTWSIDSIPIYLDTVTTWAVGDIINFQAFPPDFRGPNGEWVAPALLTTTA